MRSEVVKNWAVTILCSVTALVLVAGYLRFDRTMTLVEARSDALFSLMASVEQRNRTAFDATVKAGDELRGVLARINTDTLPQIEALVAQTSQSVAATQTSVASLLESHAALAASADAGVQRLTNEASLGVAQLNQSVGASAETLQAVLQAADERVRDPRVDQALSSTLETTVELQRGADHLANSLAAIQSSAESLQTAATHAPAVAESVDKILREQKKWSTWILIARLLSLAR